MLLPGLARTTQGSQDYQAARSLSVRTRGSFRSTRYGNLRRAALVPMAEAAHTLVGIVNRDEEP
jgi:hypothetical protein